MIAKLDRLARNVALIAQLMESGVEFVAADFPQANQLTIHILAAIAEYEAKLIFERIEAAIVASKARGVVWGGNRNSPTAHLDDARRIGNEGRRRRAIARAIDLEPLIMEMRQGRQVPQGDRCGAKPPWHSSAARRDQLDFKCCSLGLAMVSGPVSQPEKMEQVRAAI